MRPSVPLSERPFGPIISTNGLTGLRAWLPSIATAVVVTPSPDPCPKNDGSEA